MIKNNKFLPIILIIILIALGTGIYFFVRQKQATPVAQEQVLDREKILVDIQELNFVKTDMTEADREKYFDGFKREREALLEAQKLIEDQGHTADAGLYWPVFNLGNIHRDVGDLKKAESAYLLAHELQPNSYPPLGNLGELYLRYFHDLTKAEKYYLLAIEIPSDYIEYYYNELYELYRFQLKDNTKAEQLLVSGIAKYPDKYDLYIYLGTHYRQTGETAKAIEVYRNLLEKNPQSKAAKDALRELGQ